MLVLRFFFFFFNDTATTEIYTLSLHDALPILGDRGIGLVLDPVGGKSWTEGYELLGPAGRLVAFGLSAASSGKKDRKSTRLNSSHANISYAVFCLKKKKKTKNDVIQ